MLKHFLPVLFVAASMLPSATPAAEPFQLDDVSAAQAEIERQQLAEAKPRELTPAMTEYRQTAEVVHYQARERKLPGYFYRPKGAGPHPAILWNHGSEKEPRAQPELARFYTERGFVFFAPIRHGHGETDGPYIVDLQQSGSDAEKVHWHDDYNEDVVAALAWLKQLPSVDPQRIVVSGVSYGGIQTLITAQKGLGVKAFIAFAPGAMSFASPALRERMSTAVKNAQGPLLLLQAKNDYSIGPSELLGPLLASKGKPSHNTVYPAFGSTNQQGHGAFATWSLGVREWGGEALTFIDAAFGQEGVRRTANGKP